MGDGERSRGAEEHGSGETGRGGDGEQESGSEKTTAPALSAAEARRAADAERRRLKRAALLGEGPILAAGICGSGIIEAVAELFMVGILTPDGRFAPEIQTPRLTWQGRKAEFVLAWPHETSTGRVVVITSDDVRNIQLGKAALYSGARLLMDRIGVERVDRIILAGAFGSYIDPRHAMAIGMIPDCDLARVTAVGNSAGDGARIALLDRTQREEARRLARWTNYVGIALEPRFQDAFVEAMPLPHAVDAFPHLETVLADATERRAAHGINDNVSARDRRRQRELEA